MIPDEHRSRVLNWVYADCVDDHGQLWSLAKRVRETYELDDWRAVRDETLRVLAWLCEQGFVVVGSLCEGPNGLWVLNPWTGSATDHIARLRMEWDRLGRDPDIGDIAWYDVTENGRMELAALVRRERG